MAKATTKLLTDGWSYKLKKENDMKDELTRWLLVVFGALQVVLLGVLLVLIPSKGSGKTQGKEKATPLYTVCKNDKQGWEYAAQFAKDAMVTTTFDKLGNLGWEAVWCRRARAGDPGKDAQYGYECLFKRPLVTGQKTKK
jgi:hypothetical protein